MLICGTATSASTSTTDLLYESKWILIILNNQGLVMEKFSQNKPYLQLQKDDTFTAYVGCNQMRGKITTPGAETMNFAEEDTSTRMACPEYFMDLENEFLSILPKVKYWKIENDKVLYLLSEDKASLAILTNVLIY